MKYFCVCRFCHLIQTVTYKYLWGNYFCFLSFVVVFPSYTSQKRHQLKYFIAKTFLLLSFFHLIQTKRRILVFVGHNLPFKNKMFHNIIFEILPWNKIFPGKYFCWVSFLRCIRWKNDKKRRTLKYFPVNIFAKKQK